jgi:hypothetical protein
MSGAGDGPCVPEPAIRKHRTVQPEACESPLTVHIVISRQKVGPHLVDHDRYDERRPRRCIPRQCERGKSQKEKESANGAHNEVPQLIDRETPAGRLAGGIYHTNFLPVMHTCATATGRNGGCAGPWTGRITATSSPRVWQPFSAIGIRPLPGTTTIETIHSA